MEYVLATQQALGQMTELSVGIGVAVSYDIALTAGTLIAQYKEGSTGNIPPIDEGQILLTQAGHRIDATGDAL